MDELESAISRYVMNKNKAIKDLKIRYWTCPECGNEVDRDINASKNILIEGLKQM